MLPRGVLRQNEGWKIASKPESEEQQLGVEADIEIETGMGRENKRGKRGERSKTNSEAAETRRATLNEKEGNPVVEK